MGADLFFKLKDRSKVNQFNDFLLATKEGKLLSKIECCPLVHDDEDIKWAKEGDCPEHSREYFVKYFAKKYGQGVWKASGRDEGIQALGLTHEEFFSMVADMFTKAQKWFEIEFYAGSCAFTLEEHYFSIADMRKMTLNGKYLTGKTKTPENYYPLLNKLIESQNIPSPNLESFVQVAHKHNLKTGKET